MYVTECINNNKNKNKKQKEMKRNVLKFPTYRA